ncbi:MAG: endonuclease [Deltaproteobacteria bacterium]|nr:endonuclease [Deltaproteobacteria bacterium]
MRGLYLAVLTTVAIGDAACAPAPRPPAPTTVEPPAPGLPPADDDAPDEVPTGPIGASGNLRIRHFDEAKKALTRIYESAPHRIDLYCGCAFLPDPGHGLRVDLAACGYVPARDRSRAERIEWEHAVPASAFGHTFVEWREGAARCVDKRGRPFRGRKCARIASAEFARIEADLHNLFPVVGEVNGLRGDLPMGLPLPDASDRHGARGTFHFGACTSAIEAGVFMPRREVRGDLARAYKYMDRAYPERRLVDDAHRALFDAWDREDPPDDWERERNRLIGARQGNINELIGN